MDQKIRFERPATAALRQALRNSRLVFDEKTRGPQWLAHQTKEIFIPDTPTNNPTRQSFSREAGARIHSRSSSAVWNAYCITDERITRTSCTYDGAEKYLQARIEGKCGTPERTMSSMALSKNVTSVTGWRRFFFHGWSAGSARNRRSRFRPDSQGPRFLTVGAARAAFQQAGPPVALHFSTGYYDQTLPPIMRPKRENGC